MITANKKDVVTFPTSKQDGKARFDLDLISGDEKPTEFDGYKVANGSTAMEMDTSKVYMFDEENGEWKEV